MKRPAKGDQQKNRKARSSKGSSKGDDEKEGDQAAETDDPDDGDDDDDLPKQETAEEKRKKEDQKLIRDGMAIKKRYSLACERAQKTLDQIASTKNKPNKYEWARGNNEGDRKILKYLNKVKNKLDEFDTEFMLVNEKEMPSFKKKHGMPMILVRMKRIIEKLEKPIEDLEEVVQRVIKATDTLTTSNLKRRMSDEEGDRMHEQLYQEYF